MMVLATAGRLTVKVGRNFTAAEAGRLRECLSSFWPVSLLTLDFGETEDVRTDAAIALSRVPHDLQVTVALRRVAAPHLVLLRALGVRSGAPRVVGPRPIPGRSRRCDRMFRHAPRLA